MESKLNHHTIQELAELSRLQFTPDEAITIQQGLDAMLEVISAVVDVPTQDVPPMVRPFEVQNVYRLDVVQPSQERDQLLAGAPRHKDGCFAVPKTVG